MKKGLPSLVAFGLMASLATPMQAQLLANARQQPAYTTPAEQSRMRKLKDVLNELKNQHRVDILFFGRNIERYEVAADSYNPSKPLEPTLIQLLGPLNLIFKKSGRGGYVITESGSNQPTRQQEKKASNGPNTFMLGDWPTAGGSDVPKSILEKAATVQLTVSGKVTSTDDNEPMPGVSILVKGLQQGTTTDIDGAYTLNVPDENSVLIFSFVGYLAQEVTVGNRKEISISLQTDTKALSEVVVVGYGTQKKINLTGSVATVDSKQLADRPITNISSALQGTLPGVTVIQQSGQPGRDNGIIRVRGVGTMNNAAPMVVVDGVISSMENINPNDIESISVLKDASAGAIYGSRAANGVILVTTKRGQSGKPVISYNGYFGIQQLTNQARYLGSYDYANLLNEGLKNEGKQPRYSDVELEKFRTGSDPESYPDTDWMELLYQGSGIQQSHNLSFSGGADASRYLLSLGYLDQKGLIKQANSDRLNLRFNLDSKVSDRISIGLTTSFIRQGITEPSGVSGRSGIGEVIRQSHRIPPTFLNKFPNGTWARHIDGNPIAWVEEGGKMQDIVYGGLGNLFGEIVLAKGLKLRGSAGVDFNLIDKTTHLKKIEYGDGTYQGPNAVDDVTMRSVRVILQSFLSYEKSFNNHNFNFLGGTSRESLRYDENRSYRRNFPNNSLTELNAGSIDGMIASGYAYDYNLGSYFGRLNYDFKGKYLFEASMRYDGSSRFAQAKRWGLFPSFSAGWRVSEESFLRDISVINDLKIRGSYGSLGNNEISEYLYIPSITLGVNYPFGGAIQPGAAQTISANSNLRWERSTTLDLGFDLAVLNNKLTLTADYYDRYTDNILITVPVSSIYGLPAPTVNAGALRNKGFEFLLGHANRFGRFKYDASFNMGYNKSVVEKYANPSKGWRIQAEGYEWNAFYGYESIGYYQTDEDVKSLPKVPGAPVQKGDLVFKDQNGDGKIDGDDRISLGNDVPRITFGFNLNASYQNFDINIMGQGAAKVNQVLNNEIQFPFMNGAKAQVKHLDRWSPENRDAAFPTVHVDQQHNYAISSFNTVRSDYFRIKNLQLGYSLPKQLLESFKISRLRVYAGGQNLLTFTKLAGGFDPESQVNAQYRYPNVKIYTAGLNLTF